MEEHQGNDFIPSKSNNKQEKYQNVRRQFEDRLDSNSHPLSNTSNLLAILKEEFKWWWVGFYWVRYSNTEKQHLALGQFQGPPACSKLFKGTGVCAASWTQNTIINLADVHKFEGHVACSSVSKSQIVIPITKGQKVIGVLDIDSENYGTFDATDENQLTKLLKMISQINHFDWFDDHM